MVVTLPLVLRAGFTERMDRAFAMRNQLLHNRSLCGGRALGGGARDIACRKEAVQRDLRERPLAPLPSKWLDQAKPPQRPLRRGSPPPPQPPVALVAPTRRKLREVSIEAPHRREFILDVGFNVGQDTVVYLEAGYNVAAVEANPLLVEWARKTPPFRAAIDAGRLTLLNR